MLDEIRLSIGTAMALGLRDGMLPVPPTTAYLMVGNECINNCAFCTQARDSKSGSELLSRVIWPKFTRNETLSALERAGDAKIKRICLQCLVDPPVLKELPGLVDELVRRTDMSISVSISAVDLPMLRSLKDAGASRVGIALDGASKRVFDRIKGRDVGNPYTWEGNWESLIRAVGVFGEGNVSTHIIVGIGETDREVVETMVRCGRSDILVSLFAYTPMKGTKEIGEAPVLSRYRALQMARSIVMDHGVLDGFEFDDKGKLCGIPEIDVDGSVVFQTRGCPDCNRPYYNERPRGPMYNYPRLLDKDEVERAMKEALDHIHF